MGHFVCARDSTRPQYAVVPDTAFCRPESAFTNTLIQKALLINGNSFQTSSLIRWSPSATRGFVLVACAKMIACCKYELRAKKIPGCGSIRISGYSLDFRVFGVYIPYSGHSFSSTSTKISRNSQFVMLYRIACDSPKIFVCSNGFE